jgi:hypothetical protein
MSMHPSFMPRSAAGESLLRTTGQVVTMSAGDGRRSERRLVNMAADLSDPGSRRADVEVADLSKDGFMIRCSMELELKAIVWLKLVGFEPMKAEVVWTEEDRAGCSFCTPLYPAILDLIIQSQPVRQVRRVFAPPALLPPLPERRAA